MTDKTQGAVGAEKMTANPGDLLFRSEWETTRAIPHEEAREIAARLIASHFRRTDCETARAGIPARPDYDDDLLINSYIKQQARKDAALASPRADSDERTAGEVLKEACKPWEHYTGEPPDDGSPLSGVFVAGMVYTERLLAKLLDVAHYEGGDGSEDFDNDATQTLRNILIGAGLWDADENRPVSATPAQPAGAVPDGLRALFGKAHNALHSAKGALDEAGRREKVPGRSLKLYAAAEECEQAIFSIAEVLSTHPAGQSKPDDLAAGIMHEISKCGPTSISNDRWCLGHKLITQALSSHPAGQSAGSEAETDALVDRFSAALKVKLRAAEAKYGWKNGWLKSDWQVECQNGLLRHVGKGDPLDVAAYAAFCWHHGWSTSSQRSTEFVTGAVEPTAAAIAAYAARYPDGALSETSDHAIECWNRVAVAACLAGQSTGQGADLRKTLTLIREFAGSSILVRNDALDHIYVVASKALDPNSPIPEPVGKPDSASDSLRALSEAASPDWDTNDATPYILGPEIDGEIDRFAVIARGPAGCGQSGDVARQWKTDRMFAVACVKHVRRILAAHRAGQSTGQGAGISVDVATMRASNGTDYYVRIACDGREVTPHCFKERWKAEYEAAHYAWIFGLRADEPSILAFDPESHPNAPDSPLTGPAGVEEMDLRHVAQFVHAAMRSAVEAIDFEAGRTYPPLEDECGAWWSTAQHILWSLRFSKDLVLAARPAAPEAQGLERVRHVKRVTEYEVLGEAEAQIATQDYQSAKVCGEGRRILREGDKLTVYRGSDSKLWCRFTDEFRDGRFVPAPPASSGQENKPNSGE